MARSKHNRSRANKRSQHQQAAACHVKQPHCGCVQCVTDRNLSGKNNSLSTPASLGHRNPQDVMDSIEYHWKVLSTDVKHFVLENNPTSPTSQSLNLKKFVDFWSEPQHIESARGSCASSMSGSSWFLALNYLFLDKLVEAQALILHGSFMQECVCRPIRDIITICNAIGDEQQSNYDVNGQLRIYNDAFLATQSKQSMESFLHKVLPPDYRRRMSFASQASRTNNGHSIVGDYINFISNDWNDASSSSSAAASKRRTKGVDNTFIEVIFMKPDTNNVESTVTIGMSSTMKSVFNNYADEQEVSLRSLRFTHAGKLLFLSSAGNKTVEQLGIKHLDTIHVLSTTSTAQASSSPAVTPKKHNSRRPPRTSNKKSKGKSSRTQCITTTAPVTNASISRTQDKIQHSKHLSRVFDEAQPILKSIRQKLNSLHIERTLPKRKLPRRKKPKAAVAPVRNNPSAAEVVGGKAGKTHFSVQVGESCNLYKTTKRSARTTTTCLQQQQTPILADLHGLTKEEALSKLDASLPGWTDTAMKGSYPFVIPVRIVCGGGNQVLSETVENWIRENEHVSNAPKHLHTM